MKKKNKNEFAKNDCEMYYENEMKTWNNIIQNILWIKTKLFKKIYLCCSKNRNIWINTKDFSKEKTKNIYYLWINKFSSLVNSILDNKISDVLLKFKSNPLII